MKKIYTLLTSNRDCCRSLFYLCNQAIINYDAEQKKKIRYMYIYDDENVTQVNLRLSGRTVSGSNFSRPHLAEMQNEEDY